MSAGHNKNAVRFVVLTVLIDAIGFGIIMPVLPNVVMRLGHVGLAQATEIGGWLGMIYARRPVRDRAAGGQSRRPLRAAAGAARRARRLRGRLCAAGVRPDARLAVPRPRARRLLRRVVRPGRRRAGGRFRARGPRPPVRDDRRGVRHRLRRRAGDRRAARRIRRSRAVPFRRRAGRLQPAARHLRLSGNAWPRQAPAVPVAARQSGRRADRAAQGAGAAAGRLRAVLVEPRRHGPIRSPGRGSPSPPSNGRRGRSAPRSPGSAR